MSILRHLGYPLFGSVFLCSFGHAANDTDYLRQIEEAAKLQAITPIINSTQPANREPAENNRIPAGLPSLEEFEKALRQQFAGTYAFYQRLNAAGKQQIFTLYQQDNRVSTIRAQTLQLLAGNSR
ncbi:MAG: hypothetical protein V2J55_04115 [Candidatus Competibacteraceae bacterium]|jgi:hypothetical protein|nr:hypothetical protein [Candidatus Competibacteraceae bacterium]